MDKTYLAMVSSLEIMNYIIHYSNNREQLVENPLQEMEHHSESNHLMDRKIIYKRRIRLNLLIQVR